MRTAPSVPSLVPSRVLRLAVLLLLLLATVACFRAVRSTPSDCREYRPACPALSATACRTDANGCEVCTCDCNNLMCGDQ